MPGLVKCTMMLRLIDKVRSTDAIVHISLVCLLVLQRDHSIGDGNIEVVMLLIW